MQAEQDAEIAKIALRMACSNSSQNMDRLLSNAKDEYFYILDSERRENELRARYE